MHQRLGLPPMPWQNLVADVGGELVQDEATGLLLPAYRDVVIYIPRQSGKTTLILSWELQRALGWQRPQRIIYSAQTGNDARKKLIDDQFPLLERRKAKFGIRRLLRGMGNEGVEFGNGSRIGLMASGDDAGHGKTIDLGVKDEFFADVDDRRDQALGPAMITRADAQKVTASTAGTAASIPLNQLVARGRAAVRAGERRGIAYFEWSADPEADPFDPDVWWDCMPALGITISEDSIRHELTVTFADNIDEFRRAYMNITTGAAQRLIPATTWDLVNSPDAAPSGDITFGIDINPEHSAASIVAVGDSTIEVVDHRPGVSWLVGRAKELDDRWGEPWWAIDGRNSAPIAALVPDMRDAELTLVEVRSEDMPAACGLFFNRIVDQRLKIRRHPSLDAALEVAEQRFVGDAWTWDRKNSAGDISPLVAATVATWIDSELSAPNIY